MQTQHLIKLRKISRDEKPNLTIKSGDTLELDLPDFSGGLISKKSVSSDLKVIDFGKGYALAGPIYVEGARRNDILEIEFLEFEDRGWGYTAIFPEVEEFNLAYYPEERFEPYMISWDVHDGFAYWKKFGIHVPLNPFLGVVGTAPSMNGSFDPLPPRDCGGNLDIKHLITGSKLYLPVNVQGAHLFVGDPHLAMGDGEVFSSAIEAPLKVKLRVTARRTGDFIEPPMCIVSKPRVHEVYDKGYMGFIGVAKTVDEATDIACHKAMTYFCKKLDMSPKEAAILLGVAMDLTINEIPDKPNKVVTGMVPISIFEKKRFP
jgi:acetamidase/formamidase